MGLMNTIRHGWRVFTGRERDDLPGELGLGSSSPTYRQSGRFIADSDIASAAFNRIAMDAASVDIMHVKINKATDNEEIIDSGLQQCFSLEANIDQSNRDFIHDIVYSLLDEGCIAVVPTDTTNNPNLTGGYDINALRVGKIVQWFPQHVKVNLYNEETGMYEDVVVPKKTTAIIQNPLYSVVNGRNITLKRLARKLALIDGDDDRYASGAFNMILQLPYAVKNNALKQRMEERIKELEAQLRSNNYGIGYIDATEKVTQLNRPFNNQLLDEIKHLTDEFYSQIGLTQNVFNGTASETEMRGYYSRTVDPILRAITAEFRRKFLTKTARTQGHDITFYRDPFVLTSIEQITQLIDPIRRNEVLTSNELRRKLGHKPSGEPQADRLSNPNIADKNQMRVGMNSGSLTPPEEDDVSDEVSDESKWVKKPKKKRRKPVDEEEL